MISTRSCARLWAGQPWARARAWRSSPQTQSRHIERTWIHLVGLWSQIYT